MSVCRYRRAGFLTRSRRGSQIVETTGAFLVLVFCFMLPLLNLAVIPLRWTLSYSVLESNLRMLARCDKYSQARQVYFREGENLTPLKRLGGVQIERSKLYLTLHYRGQSLQVEEPGKIPVGWLNPDVQYVLTRATTISLSPLVASAGQPFAVPGLTAPVCLHLVNNVQWENGGIDPFTAKYYVNE